MTNFNYIFLSIFSLLLSGCFSIEHSKWLVSKPTNLPSEFSDEFHGKLPFVVAGKSKIYINSFSAKRLSSQCVGGMLLIPADIKLKGEATENDIPYLVKIGVRVGSDGVLLDLSKIKIIYKDSVYSGSNWKWSDRPTSIPDIMDLAQKDKIYWFQSFFPVYIDASENYSMDIDGFTVNGTPFPKVNVNFSPVEVSETHDYGERGC